MLTSPSTPRKRPLKVGLHVPNSRSWEETLAMARRAAEVGSEGTLMAGC